MMVPDWAGYLAVRDAFAQAMDHRLYTLEWLDQQIISGEARFWRTERAAIVAELRRYPTGNMDVHGLIAAGAPEDIVNELIPAAEEWGRSMGCLGAIIESRSAWARLLKDSGYAPHQLALRKELA